MTTLFLLLLSLTSASPRKSVHPSQKINLSSQEITLSLQNLTLPPQKNIPQKDSSTWLSDFRDFRNAVYQHDHAKVKQFIDFPIMNYANEIWYLTPTGNKESTDRVPEKIKPFSENDFDKYFNKLFPKRFITTLLKIRSADLYKTGSSETQNFQEGSTTYKMTATYDKEENKLELNLFSNTVEKNKDGETEDGGESSIIYQFNILKSGHLKFIQIRLAG